MQTRMDIADDTSIVGFCATTEDVYCSQGEQYTKWEQFLNVPGYKHLTGNIDMLAAFFLRQNAPVQIYANEQMVITHIVLGKHTFYSLERYGYTPGELCTPGYVARCAQQVAGWLASNNWRLRASLGSTGFNDVIGSYLQAYGIRNAYAALLSDWKTDYTRGLTIAGREHSEPGEYNRAYCYDVNSAHGACCAMLLPEPGRLRLEREPSKPYHILRRNHGAMCCRVRLPADRYGLLPVRVNGQLDYCRDGGTRFGVWTTNELRYAVGAGAEIEHCYWSLVTERAQPYLQQFAQDCYAEKLAAQNAGDTAARTFWKLLVNSTIGRFAAVGGLKSCERWAYGKRMHFPAAPPYDGYIVSDDRQVVLATRPVPLPGRANRLWAAMIFAEQRCNIHAAATACNAFYIDTDCVMCPDEYPFLLGEEMGQWAYKGGGRVTIRDSKMYRSEWDRPKARGVPAAMAGAYLAGEKIELSRKKSWYREIVYK